MPVTPSHGRAPSLLDGSFLRWLGRPWAILSHGRAPSLLDGSFLRWFGRPWAIPSHGRAPSLLDGSFLRWLGRPGPGQFQVMAGLLPFWMAHFFGGLADRQQLSRHGAVPVVAGFPGRRSSGVSNSISSDACSYEEFALSNKQHFSR